MKKYFLIFSLLLLIFSSSAGAGRLLVLQLDTSQLTNLADKVIDVRCLEVKREKDNEGRLVDIVTVFVNDVIKGNLKPGDRMSFRQLASQPGSVVEGMMPEFRAGKEYLLFLSDPVEEGGYTTTVGLKQGAFEITRGGQDSFLSPLSIPAKERHDSFLSPSGTSKKLDYESFVSSVRRLVKRK